jgi:hypothetical protein
MKWKKLANCSMIKNDYENLKFYEGDVIYLE